MLYDDHKNISIVSGKQKKKSVIAPITKCLEKLLFLLLGCGWRGVCNNQQTINVNSTFEISFFGWI